MKILFFPNDRGGGFGHLSRCLAVSREAKRRGHECGFVLSQARHSDTIGQCHEVFLAAVGGKPKPLGARVVERALAALRSLRGTSPCYRVIPSVDYQIVRDGLVDEETVLSVLQQYRRVIETFQPDILFGDGNLLAWIVAKRHRIPIAQIVQSAYHPKGGRIIWWKEVPEGLVPPRGLHLFNSLLEKMKLDPIARTEDLFTGDLYLIPNIPDLEPFPDRQTFHIGELTLSQPSGGGHAWFQGMDNSQPLLYVTVGGGAVEAGRLLVSTVVKAFEGRRVQVIIATGNTMHPKDFHNSSKNIRIHRWVPGRLLVSQADLVLFHGGHTTMIETVASGKPSLVLPFHSEQEGNGRRLEQAGCAMVVPQSRGEYQRVTARWNYGSYSYLVQNTFDLKPEDITEKATAILDTNEYSLNAQSLQKKMQEYRGSEAAMDLAEQYRG